MNQRKKIILPTVLKLKKRYKLKRAIVADTVFIKEYKRYDVIVGMYHDQVLAPFKSILNLMYKFNFRIKIFEIISDHGVAKSLIKKNKADPSSLIECIQFLNKFGLWDLQKISRQNFLIDKNIILKIKSTSIKNKNVIEIGLVKVH